LPRHFVPRNDAKKRFTDTRKWRMPPRNDVTRLRVRYQNGVLLHD